MENREAQECERESQWDKEESSQESLELVSQQTAPAASSCVETETSPPRNLGGEEANEEDTPPSLHSGNTAEKRFAALWQALDDPSVSDAIAVRENDASGCSERPSQRVVSSSTNSLTGEQDTPNLHSALAEEKRFAALWQALDDPSVSGATMVEEDYQAQILAESRPSPESRPGAWAVFPSHTAVSQSDRESDASDDNMGEEQEAVSALPAERVEVSIDELRQANEIMQEILTDQAPPPTGTSAVPLDDQMREAGEARRGPNKTRFVAAGFLGLTAVIIVTGILVAKMIKSEPPVVLRNTLRPTTAPSQAPSWESSQYPSISSSPSSSVQPSTSLAPSVEPCSVNGPVTSPGRFSTEVDEYWETGYSRHGNPIGRWCVESVREFNWAFYNRSTFNEPLNLWDVSSARQMRGMFEYASSFSQDLSSWNVSRVERMDDMFFRASSFNQDLSSWDVSKVERMDRMFDSAVTFSQDLSSWNVARVSTMHSMFYFAHAFNGNVSTWDVSRVEDMGSMFFFAPLFNGDISAWNVSRVINMREMFERADDLGRNRDLSLWDVSNVEDMQRMFFAAAQFNGNVSTWDVSRVVTFGSMFARARSFRQDLCGWGAHMRRDADVRDMFLRTDCPEQGDPNLTATPVSPLCFACT